MNQIWKMNNEQLYDLSKKEMDYQIDVGDITVICHTSNQSALINRLVTSARHITDKIIILDDCSKDSTVDIARNLGCRVFSIPEGWIYTHGFGKLLETQQRLCESEYHMQVDTGEYIYVPEDAAKHTEQYYWTLRVHYQADTKHPGFRQPMINRLFKTDAPLTVKSIIHGSPIEPQAISNKLKHSDIIVFHGSDKHQGDCQCYLDRKERLYCKLLQKGYKERTLENDYWYKHYEQHKKLYDDRVRIVEEKIGILELTDKDIKEIT